MLFAIAETARQCMLQGHAHQLLPVCIRYHNAFRDHVLPLLNLTAAARSVPSTSGRFWAGSMIVRDADISTPLRPPPKGDGSPDGSGKGEPRPAAWRRALPFF